MSGTSARSSILGKIAAAVGNHGANVDAEYAQIHRSYVRAGQAASGRNLDVLTSRLRDYDAGVYHCAPGDVAVTVATAMERRNKKSLLRSADVPDAWLPAQFRFRSGAGLDYSEIDLGEGVVTGCAAAIAFTGTLILRHSAGEAARALTLIPDYHLCIVTADQIVETVPEGFARLAGSETRPLTTISGPSATADIEMTRVKGVHGPRFLDVILVS